jgi:hypothetical protein
MDLVEKLQSINDKGKLNKDTLFKIICNDGQIVTGNYAGFTQALDNEPEIAQIDVYNKNGTLIGVYENEIKSIEVI